MVPFQLKGAAAWPVVDHPLEEAVYRDNAAALAICITEGRQLSHGLALGVDRLAPSFRVLAPVGDETPTQGIERYHAGLMIAPDHQQVLAGRGVPARRIIVNAAIARVQSVDDGETYRRAALDESPAHDRYVATGGSGDQSLEGFTPADPALV